MAIVADVSGSRIQQVPIITTRPGSMHVKLKRFWNLYYEHLKSHSMSFWERTHHILFSSEALSSVRKNRNSKRGMRFGAAGEILMELFQEGVVDANIFLDPHFLVLPKNPMLLLPPVGEDVGTVGMYSSMLASRYPEHLYYLKTPMLHISYYPEIRQRIEHKSPLLTAGVKVDRDRKSGSAGPGPSPGELESKRSVASVSKRTASAPASGPLVGEVSKKTSESRARSSPTPPDSKSSEVSAVASGTLAVTPTKETESQTRSSPVATDSKSPGVPMVAVAKKTIVSQDLVPAGNHASGSTDGSSDYPTAVGDPGNPPAALALCSWS